MRTGRQGAAVLAWMLFLFVLPFGEGSASPEGLLAAHLIFLAAVAVSVRDLDPDRPMLVSVFVVLGAAGVSGILGSYRFASWIVLIDLAVLLGVLVLGESMVRRSGEAQAWLLRTIVAAGVLQAALILVWRIAGWGRFAPGTFQNPSHAGAYMIAAFWALVAERALFAGSREARTESDGAADGMEGDRSRASWSVLAIGGLLLSAGLVQASRGVLLALIAGGFVFLALRFRTWTRRARTLAALAAMVLVVVGGSALAYRFATKTDPYLWDRLQLWRVALQVAMNHPAAGCGPGVYPHITAPLDVPHFDGPVHYAKHVEATHSDPLRVLAETGLIGALAFLALFGVWGRRALRGVGTGGGVEAALAAAVSGLLVQSTVENLSFRPAVSYTGAMMAAILAARAAGRVLSKRASSPASVIEIVTGASPPAFARESGPAASPSKSSRDSVTEPSRYVSTIEPFAPDLPWAFATLSSRVLLHGGLVAIAILFVVAPYLGHSSFRLFQTGAASIGEHYRSAVWWNRIQPDYRAALADAVLAAKEPRPEDLNAGLLAVDEAIALKPIDARYFLTRARLGRRALGAGRADASWVALADTAYTRALSLDPHRPQSRLERGWMLLDLGRAREALDEAATALDSEPNSFEARRLRAAALFEMGDLDDARAEMDEARRRHGALVGYSPADGYEATVIRWDDEGWLQLEQRLGAAPSPGSRPD